MANQSFEKSWRNRFEKYANFETDAKIAGWSEHSLNTRVAAFKDNWKPPQKNGTWIDIGCGAGTYTEYLLENNQTTVAADYSFPTLLKAKHKLKDSARYLVADVRHLPLKANYFDGILCFGVLQALSTPLDAIDELSQMIKNDGEIWVDGLNRRGVRFIIEWLKHRVSKAPYRLVYVSPWHVSKRFKQLGLNQLDIVWLPIMPAKFAKYQSHVVKLVNKIGKVFPVLACVVSHAFIIKAKKDGNKR